MALTHEEQELFVELGYHIARVMWQNLGRSDPTYQSVMHDKAESVYERGCLIMWDLGVFRSEKSSLYRFAMPLEEVRDHLRGASPGEIYSFEQIIGNFLWATAGYQGDVSDEKVPFEVPGYLQQAMWAFVKLGYATREPEGFLWSEKIAPIMIAEHLWSREGESRRTLDRQRMEELTEQIWTAIPLWRRHLLARWIVGKTGNDVSFYIVRRWDGKTLRLFERPKGEFIYYPPEVFDAAYEITARLIEIRRSHPI